MATALTHALMALPFAPRDRDGALSKPLVAIGALLAVAPDFDVLWYRHFPPGDMLSHRGLTHSLAVALALSALAALLVRRRVSPTLDVRPFLYFFGCLFSHAALDMVTVGARGVALLAPFDDARFLSPVRFISAAWFSPRRALADANLAILATELRLVWIPAIAIFLLRARMYNRPAVAPAAGAARDQDPGRR
jgi:membrane-bound metal-dependent hydrolase YbcI (DUF457 family)